MQRTALLGTRGQMVTRTPRWVVDLSKVRRKEKIENRKFTIYEE